MRLRVAAAALLGVAISCGERAPVTAEQLPGTYAVTTGAVHDTIELRRDGTAIHRLWSGKFLTVEERGTWAAGAYGDGAPAIDFHDITPLADRSPPYTPGHGFWLARVEHSLRGRVTIVLDQDTGTLYTPVE